jgi:signal transduction histidine kinase
MSQNGRIADAPAHILIVDDDVRDRQLMEILLTSEGYRLQTAASGQEALAMVKQEPPDLVLLDVMMPGTDGYQVTAEIKANAASKNIPVILFTALDDRQARLLGLESGAEDFLSKPLDGAELLVRVRNLLRLKAAYEELNRRNDEIASALAEARDARKEAEDANAAKTHFLRVMSHELRTPLNAISGYAQLLELGVRGPLGAEQTQDVVKIKSAAGYLTRLIGDVLTAEKFEVARPLEPVPIAVRPLLAEVEGLCVLQARERGVSLAISSPTTAVFVMADAERFQQILLNLVTNAIKFTHKSGSVDVTCSSDSKLVYVQVSDTGIGIAATDVERVFDPFVQIDRHLTHVAEQGVGLGLSISRQLARAMGGDLTLQSTVGAGSAFTLTLPAAVGADLQKANSATRTTALVGL